MRVVLVGPAHPHRGGIAQYTSSLYIALEQHHDPLLLSFVRQYPSLLFPGTTQNDDSGSPFLVPCEPVIDSLDPVSWKRAAERIAGFQPDLVIFQWWQPFFGEAYATMIRRVREQWRVPVLFLCHNVYSHREWGFPGRKKLESLLIRRAFRGVDGFLVQAREMVNAVSAFRPGADIRTIHHPLYDFYARWDDLGLSSAQPEGTVRTGPPVLLFFGTIREYKGLKTLIEALSLLPPGLDFRAVIAGEFYTDPKPYRRLAERLGVDSRIQWLDRYIPNEEVPPLFRRSDLVVLPYLEATQSGVVPVAYQFGIPVIASAVGGLSEVVLDGRTGYLVPPADPAALASSIVRFFKEAKAAEFRANIASFRSELSWRRVVETIEELGAVLKNRE